MAITNSNTGKPQPIQRTIVEEGAEQATQTTVKQSSENQAGKTVVFGLISIFLVFIAIGAVVLFWQRYSKTTDK